MPPATHDTEPDVSPEEIVTWSTSPFETRLADLRGLDHVVDRLTTTFLPALTDPDAVARTPALLAYGPSKAGQRRLAKAVVQELADVGFECAHLSPDPGTPADSQNRIRDGATLSGLLSDLAADPPVTLFVDGIADIPLRQNGPFQTAIDELRTDGTQAAVIGTLSVNRGWLSPDRAPEYFSFADYTIDVTAGDSDRRAAVLAAHLDEVVAGTALTVAADATAALQQADATVPFDALATAARRAALRAEDSDTTATVTTDTLVTAIETVVEERPKTTPRQGCGNDTEQYRVQQPAVTFADVGGLADICARLEELVSVPDQFPALYDETPLSATAGVLLHGPPGTGKTLLARALAGETGRRFYAVEGTAVKSKWFGESERRIRALFEAARRDAPSLIYFDEFDALAGDRRSASHSAVRSLVTTLLTELDGVTANDDVLVVAATNRPDRIDPAIRRPGRVGEAIEIPPPGLEGRREIFRIHTRGVPTAAAVTPAWFAETVPAGVTGATIASIVERAGHAAVQRVEGTTDMRLTRADFQASIDTVCEDTDATETTPRAYR